MRFLSAVLLILGLGLSSPQAYAQTPTEPIFESYEDLRATLDELMSKRQIADLLTAFGGADEMTLQDMMGVETQVRNVFPADFQNSALMMRQEMENGFTQDLIAYWTDVSYVYVRVLWHARPEGDVVSLHMVFNSNLDVLLPLF